MATVQSVQYVWGNQPLTQPPAPAPTTVTPTWPAPVPQQPVDNWGGQYPAPQYPAPQYPQPTTPQYPGYPTTPTTPQYPGYPQQPGTTTDGGLMGMLGSMKGWITGAIAGLKANRTIGRAVSASRRSRASQYRYDSGYPRGYGGNYRTQSYRANSGRARVGMSGRMGSQFFNAVKTSAIIGSVISVVTNGWELMNNRITFAQAGSNVVGDVMSSVVGGVGGAAASALGTAMLAGVLGPTMLGVASIGLGIVGYMLADGLLRNTNFFKNTTGKVQQMLT